MRQIFTLLSLGTGAGGCFCCQQEQDKRHSVPHLRTQEALGASPCCNGSEHAEIERGGGSLARLSHGWPTVSTTTLCMPCAAASTSTKPTRSSKARIGAGAGYLGVRIGLNCRLRSATLRYKRHLLVCTCLKLTVIPSRHRECA